MAHIDSGSAIVLVVEILLVLARRHALCYNVFRRLHERFVRPNPSFRYHAVPQYFSRVLYGSHLTWRPYGLPRAAQPQPEIRSTDSSTSGAHRERQITEITSTKTRIIMFPNVVRYCPCPCPCPCSMSFPNLLPFFRKIMTPYGHVSLASGYQWHTFCLVFRSRFEFLHGWPVLAQVSPFSSDESRFGVACGWW